MKYAILLLTLMLTACGTTVPVTVKFPDAPVKSGATERCPQLKKLQDDPTLSEISKTITLNYGTYYGLNLGQRIMIRFRYIETTTLRYNLSDLIFIENA